jgi:fatty-acyl-CoA synthase
MLPTVEERRSRLEETWAGQWRPRTIDQVLDVVAGVHPDRPVVVTDERVYTYADIQDWSTRIAHGLTASGVAPGDHVALVVANYPEFIALKFGIARAGAVAVPVNYLLRRDEMGYVLAQSDAKILITMNRFRNMDYLQALDELSPGWEEHGGGARLPRLREVFVFSTDGDRRAGARTLDDLAGHGADGGPMRSPADPQSPADIVYTSGTTGTPKGVLVSHDSLVRIAYASAYTRAFQDGRRMLFALPLYHVFGYVEGLLAALFVGGAVTPQPMFDALGTLQAIERHRIDEVLLVPTMTLAVLDVARQKTFDLSSLSVVFSSGGQSPASVWQEVRDLLGAEEIFTAYGMTETTASTTCTQPDDPMERLLTGQGRLKPAGVAGDPELGGLLALYKTVDLATGEDLPPGAEGELLVKGPAVTRGYYNKPEETNAAFDPNGWLRTGDIGRIDGDGYLSLTGRKKETYRCGGELVVPKEIEDVLLAYPGVVQAHVVPVPHRRMGVVGAAFIVFDDDVIPDPAAIVSYCGERLARFKVPAHIFPISDVELPTSASGKIQKFMLAERAVRELEAGAG